MKRRTFISLMSVMAAAGVLSLAGCSSNTSASTASSTAASASASTAAANKLETIQSNGKLVIALEGAWQPWSFHDESDTLVGYDVEVSRAIAEKLGVEPEYVESDWDSLFAGLDAGRYDLVYDHHRPLNTAARKFQQMLTKAEPGQTAAQKQAENVSFVSQ